MQKYNFGNRPLQEIGIIYLYQQILKKIAGFKHFKVDFLVAKKVCSGKSLLSFAKGHYQNYTIEFYSKFIKLVFSMMPY